jgi:hypothetical protein
MVHRFINLAVTNCEEQGIHSEAIQAARAVLITDEALTDLAEIFSALPVDLAGSNSAYATAI